MAKTKKITKWLRKEAIGSRCARVKKVQVEREITETNLAESVRRWCHEEGGGIFIKKNKIEAILDVLLIFQMNSKKHYENVFKTSWVTYIVIESIHIVCCIVLIINNQYRTKISGYVQHSLFFENKTEVHYVV